MPCKMQASNALPCVSVLACSQGAGGYGHPEFGWLAHDGEAWVHSFCMLTFVFVHSGKTLYLCAPPVYLQLMFY